jgi:hypothetical protein
MTRTQRWTSVAAAVAFLALPVVGSAEDETKFDKQWRPTPAVSAPASQEPTASLAPQRPTDVPFRSAQEPFKPRSLSASEADYRRVNPSIHTD